MPGLHLLGHFRRHPAKRHILLDALDHLGVGREERLEQFASLLRRGMTLVGGLDRGGVLLSLVTQSQKRLARGWRALRSAEARTGRARQTGHPAELCSGLVERKRNQHGHKRNGPADHHGVYSPWRESPHGRASIRYINSLLNSARTGQILNLSRIFPGRRLALFRTRWVDWDTPGQGRQCRATIFARRGSTWRLGWARVPASPSMPWPPTIFAMSCGSPRARRCWCLTAVTANGARALRTPENVHFLSPSPSRAAGKPPRSTCTMCSLRSSTRGSTTWCRRRSRWVPRASCRC